MPDVKDLMDTPLYGELRKLAKNRLWAQPGQSLQPTMLVHEAFLRLEKKPGHEWQSRTEFRRAAAHVMRLVLADHIRQKYALKRGGGQQHVDIQVTLPGREAPVCAEDFLALHAALDDMREQYPDHTEMVMLRYFAGFTVSEVAQEQKVSVSEIERRWRFAKAWLRTRMSSATSTK